MQILVLGMHRSGTSMFTRLLNLMGAYFGSEGISTGANEENSKGFWERKDVRALNDYVLQSCGCDWDRIAKFDVEKIPAEVLENFRLVAARVILEMDGHRPWVLKEPRLSLLLPLWLDLLEAPICIHVHRDPDEVAASLTKRNGFAHDVGLGLWEAYVSATCQFSQGLPGFRVSHRELIQSPYQVVASSLEKLSELGVTGLRLPAEAEVNRFISDKLYRQRAEQSQYPAGSGESVRKMHQCLLDGRPDSEIAALEKEGGLAKSIALHESGLPEIEAPAAPQTMILGPIDQGRRISEIIGGIQSISSRVLGDLRDRDRALERERSRYVKDIRERDRKLESQDKRIDEFIGDRRAMLARNDALSANNKSLTGRNEVLTAEKNRLNARNDQLLARNERLSQRLDASVTETFLLKDHVARLQGDLSRERKSLAALRERHSRDTTRDAEEIARLKKVVEHKKAKILELENSRSWRATRPFRGAARVVQRGFGGQAARKADIEELKNSRWFDAQWYQKTYPDIASSGADPAAHYLEHGAAEGRNPGPEFDSLYYFSANPDVADSGANPLLHFVRHGEREGRSARPPDPTRGGGAYKPRSISGRGAGMILGAPPPIKKKLPMTALVVAWDVGHNPLGRAYMLAEVLERVVRNVIIVGFQYPRYGQAVWEPVRHGALPVIALPGRNFPEFLEQLEQLSERISPDVVFACKARLPSTQFGAMIKARTGCPLVLDIDDHELSFFKDAKALSLRDLEKMPAGSAADQLEPYSELWTRLAQSMRQFSDEVIVSNIALQKEFGGTIVPHVRDEALFDPAVIDRAAVRSRLGVAADAKVLLFFGTPRAHKGINLLAEAISKIEDPRFKLVIVGTATDRRDVARLESIAPGRVQLIPNQPFEDIPEVVSIADVICLPQDPKSPVSAYQLPAKVIDAIAMGVPTLVVPTPPLQPLIDAELVGVADMSQLSESIIKAATADPDDSRQHRIRQSFLAGYSYAAAAQILYDLITRVLGNRPLRVDPKPFQKFLAEQSRVLGIGESSDARGKPESAESGVDIIVLWKQNDTTLYGRRHDMVIKYLASRPDVRKIVVFDAPLSETELSKARYFSNALTQDREIYERTIKKQLGLLDSEKICYRVFVHPPGTRGNSGPVEPAHDPLYQRYVEFLKKCLREENVRSDLAILWLYPKNEFGGALIDDLAPKCVVSDVVDDHRTWPSISQSEKDKYTRQYSEMLGRSDFVLANCESVQISMGEFCEQVALIPNGIDDRISTERNISHPVFAEMCESGKTVIGFCGNLEKKIDQELLLRLSSELPDRLIVLIGSTHANPEILGLSEQQNIRMVGVVPYEDVGTWVAKFDVAIIPHLRTAMTQNMNPLKMYVYLALGVPVVSTDVDNLETSIDLLQVAHNADTFVEKVAALTGKKRLEAKDESVSELIAGKSWSARLEQTCDQILQKVVTDRNVSTGAGVPE